jgi:hypothetical protein
MSVFFLTLFITFLRASTQTALQKQILHVFSRPLAFNCSIPENTTLLTYTNAYHFGMLEMQRRGLSPSDRECVHSRFLTGCMDEACLALCSERNIPNCYPEHYRSAGNSTQNPEALVKSDFKKGDYFKILMVKWQMLDDALQLGSGNVSAVFFFDADVLLLQNPFMHFDYMKYDFRYQVEAGDGCTAAVNGGQLFVRNTNAGRQFIGNMMARSPEILAGKLLDQRYTGSAASKARATMCALDKTKFAGNMPNAHHSNAALADMVSFHANGITTESRKVARLEAFLSAWEELASTSSRYRFLNTTSTRKKGTA